MGEIIRKVIKWVFLIIMLGSIVCLFGIYPTFPLDDKIQSISIKKHDINPKAFGPNSIPIPNAPTGLDWEVEVTEEKQIKEIERSMKIIWRPVLYVGSYEGLPKYIMTALYENGNAEDFHFISGEMTSGGITPKRLLIAVEKIFSDKAPKAKAK